MSSAAAHLDAVWRRALKDPDTREIWEWAHDEGELPNVYAAPGRFKIDTCPFAKEPFRALRDPRIRQVTSKAAVQSLKTLIGELWLLWLIDNDPGPTQWVQPDDQEAKEHAEERFNKLIESFPIVSRYFSANCREKGITKIIFRHMWMRFEGAGLGNAQRKSVKNQMCSEIWQADKWKPGTLKEFDSRLTQFPHNSKRYVESQPGFAAHLELDDMAMTYNAGSQEVWQFKCQGCGKLQPYLWSYFTENGTRRAMRWETSPRTMRETTATDPNQVYKWEELQQTIRYECIYCGHPHHDDPTVRRRMLDSGEYKVNNPEAPKDHRSFNWNQLTVINLSWFASKAGGVKNFLIAHHCAKQGLDKLQRDFFNKVMGFDYDPEQFAKFARIETIELLSRPTPEKVLEHEGIKFPHLIMSSDVQERSFFTLVEGYSDRGDSFTLWGGELFSWDEIRRKQLEYSVPDQNVACDISHRDNEVIQNCAVYGHWSRVGMRNYWLCWKALRGSDAVDFHYTPARGPQKGMRISLPYSWPPLNGNPCVGLPGNDPRLKEYKDKYVQICRWSNPTIKDVVILRRDGRAPGVRSFTARGEWNELFAKHMHSQKKVYESGQYGIGKWKWEKFRDDHLFDCKCMNIVRAFQLHLIGPPLLPEEGG